ncbi:MAG: nucleotidyltransferase family protein, partial [Oscillospiraceae bacterium]|nr:nucleotidyltransferase family protein [Oscillospiraceae bacterium]
QTEPYLPAAAARVLEEARERGLFPADGRRLELALLARLRALSLEELAALPDVSEGLENRLYNAIRASCSIEELEAAVKTKRYTLARVRRLILSAFLGIRADDAAACPPYIRILGLGKGGREILARMKSSATLPVDTSLKRLSRRGGGCERTAALEAASADLYALALPVVLPCGYDQTAPAVKAD